METDTMNPATAILNNGAHLASWDVEDLIELADTTTSDHTRAQVEAELARRFNPIDAFAR